MITAMVFWVLVTMSNSTNNKGSIETHPIRFDTQAECEKFRQGVERAFPPDPNFLPLFKAACVKAEGARP